MEYILFLIGCIFGGYCVYEYIKGDARIQAQIRDETIKNLKVKIERLESQNPKKSPIPNHFKN